MLLPTGIFSTGQWCCGFCVMGCGTRGQTRRLSWAPLLGLREGVEGFPPKTGVPEEGQGSP